MRQASLFSAPAAVPGPSRPRRRSPGLRLVVLGSGSQGNALVVESSHGRLLVDAGFSAREIARRLATVGLRPDQLDALLLTHEHHDHVCGAPALARRHGLDVYGTAGTLESVPLDEDASARVMRSGRPCEVAGFRVEPFAVPHDAREPVGLVVEDAGGCRLGLVADLGCRSHLAWARLERLHVLVLETNHDLEMLRNGPYPWPVKQRVASRHGHLSNRQAVEGLAALVHEELQWVVLYHLSRTNNLAALAATEVGGELERVGSPARVVVSRQDTASGWIEVS